MPADLSKKILCRGDHGGPAIPCRPDRPWVRPLPSHTRSTALRRIGWVHLNPRSSISDMSVLRRHQFHLGVFGRSASSGSITASQESAAPSEAGQRTKRKRQFGSRREALDGKGNKPLRANPAVAASAPCLASGVLVPAINSNSCLSDRLGYLFMMRGRATVVGSAWEPSQIQMTARRPEIPSRGLPTWNGQKAVIGACSGTLIPRQSMPDMPGRERDGDGPLWSSLCCQGFPGQFWSCC